MEDGDNAVYNVGMDEFQPPTPMQVRYCSKLTEDEFHEQGTCETEKALKVRLITLCIYMDVCD